MQIYHRTKAETETSNKMQHDKRIRKTNAHKQKLVVVEKGYRSP